VKSASPCLPVASSGAGTLLNPESGRCRRSVHERRQPCIPIRRRRAARLVDASFTHNRYSRLRRADRFGAGLLLHARRWSRLFDCCRDCGVRLGTRTAVASGQAQLDTLDYAPSPDGTSRHSVSQRASPRSLDVPRPGVFRQFGSEAVDTALRSRSLPPRARDAARTGSSAASVLSRRRHGGISVGAWSPTGKFAPLMIPASITCTHLESEEMAYTAPAQLGAHLAENSSAWLPCTTRRRSRP